MPTYFIDQNNSYYETITEVNPRPDSIVVPQRPSENHQWQNGTWVYVAPSADVLAAAARAKRNRLLTASDWTQIADAPVDKTAWTTYRQALRDIPQQENFPKSILWPSKPE